MDFRYSEEQLALQDTLRRFIARDYDFERRRALARSPLGFSAEAWDQYAELGLLALPLPEQFGGLGGNGFDIMAVMETVGQGLLLEPYLTTVVLCGGLIRDAASGADQQAILPQIAAGKLKIALAAYEAAGRYQDALESHKKFHALYVKIAEAGVQRRAGIAAIGFETEKLRRQAMAAQHRAMSLESENLDLLPSGSPAAFWKTVSPNCRTGAGWKPYCQRQLALANPIASR